MERILQPTADGSHTVVVPSLSVTYHSKHGAIQESRHVFIEAGWKSLDHDRLSSIHILEMGFGTGLNALLTLMEAGDKKVLYESIEQFPLPMDMVAQLNYCEQLGRPDLEEDFLKMHRMEWNQPTAISTNFTLTKIAADLNGYQPNSGIDLIYFDAFAPNTQPELWTAAIFSVLYAAQKDGGILVTYCSKGDVRRALVTAGYRVDKISGPPGKREMLRATKIPIGAAI